MAAFVFKVFTLTLRTAAKPLALRFQQFVLTHPTLRPRVVKLAQVQPLRCGNILFSTPNVKCTVAVSRYQFIVWRN